MRTNSELIDLLPDDFVEDYYKKNWIDDIDIRDLVYYIRIWDFMDDSQFVKDWIDGEEDYYYEDFTHTFEKDNVIEHIIENVKLSDVKEIMSEYDNDYDELEDLLDSLSFDEIKDIMENHLDIFYFIKNYLEDRYHNYGAYDILSEFHSDEELNNSDILKNYNLDWYFNEEKAREYLNNNEDWYYINERVSDDLEYSVILQEKLFEVDKSTVKEIIEFTNSDFIYTYEFQKEFMKRRKKKAIKKLYKTKILRDDIYEKYRDYLAPKIEAMKMGLL